MLQLHIFPQLVQEHRPVLHSGSSCAGNHAWLLIGTTSGDQLRLELPGYPAAGEPFAAAPLVPTGLALGSMLGSTERAGGRRGGPCVLHVQPHSIHGPLLLVHSALLPPTPTAQSAVATHPPPFTPSGPPGHPFKPSGPLRHGSHYLPISCHIPADSPQ